MYIYLYLYISEYQAQASIQPCQSSYTDTLKKSDSILLNGNFLLLDTMADGEL